MSSKAKLRTYTSFLYQAGSWRRPRKVVARLECSLQPGENGMRQEVDIRYVVTSLKGSARQSLYALTVAVASSASGLRSVRRT